MPPFLAWEYLMSNELSLEEGSKLYYEDKEGEMVSEEEEGEAPQVGWLVVFF
jgi:hypothetical protein